MMMKNSCQGIYGLYNVKLDPRKVLTTVYLKKKITQKRNSIQYSAMDLLGNGHSLQVWALGLPSPCEARPRLLEGRQ